ncbi:hypothetical protein HF086_009993 [Spodoptera exigua]|uniref:Uncharacterized protein n=1 Tax=Spodoptera exigua TaxID=7107 RepID=A0A922MSS7_SPOEX|nr:hypothetical protein HF086_009993 [Spodoptera exigua]
MRHYFILTDLEVNTKTYLTPLHARFIAEFPEMNASKQRIGDQRRAIVQRNFLSEQEIRTIKEEVRQLLQNQPSMSQCSTDNDHTQTRRMRWTTNLNETIMRSYYRLTKLETDLTTYRPLLHQDTILKCPSLAHLSAQRISDQRRSIVNNHLLSSDRLNQIKEEVRLELISINMDNTEFVTPQQTALETQTPPTLTNTNDNNIEQATLTITNDINPQTTAQNTLNLPTDILGQLEEMYTNHYNKFKDSEPTTRPYIPKLKPSRKLAAIIDNINAHILPKHIPQPYSTGLELKKLIKLAIDQKKSRGGKKD